MIMMRPLRNPSTPTPALRTEGGASCELTADGRSLVLRDREGVVRVKFSGDRCEIVTPRDLTVSAPDGVLRLHGDAIRLEDGQGGALALEDAHLVVQAETCTVESERLDIRATDRLRVFVERFEGMSRSVQHVAETIDVRAGRWMARIGERIERVRGLAETRAGRMRIEVERAMHTRAERVNIRASREVDVDGERIQLG